MKCPLYIQCGPFEGLERKAVKIYDPSTKKTENYKEYVIKKCKAFKGWYYMVIFLNGNEFKSETFDSYESMQSDLIYNHW